MVSLSVGGGNLSSQAGSTYTWQVEHRQALWRVDHHAFQFVRNLHLATQAAVLSGIDRKFKHLLFRPIRAGQLCVPARVNVNMAGRTATRATTNGLVELLFFPEFQYVR